MGGLWQGRFFFVLINVNLEFFVPVPGPNALRDQACMHDAGGMAARGGNSFTGGG